MLLPKVTPIRDVRELERWENTPFINSLPLQLTPMCSGVPRASGQKTRMKRFRTAFTAHQMRALEASFRRSRYIERDQRISLARDLNLPEKQIKVWFQNRRMKQKREITEGCAAESSPSSSVDLSNSVDPVDFTCESNHLASHGCFSSMGNKFDDYLHHEPIMETQQENVYLFPDTTSVEPRYSPNVKPQGSDLGFPVSDGYSSLLWDMPPQNYEAESTNGFSYQVCGSSTTLGQFCSSPQNQQYPVPDFQYYGAYNDWSCSQGNSYQRIY